VEGENIFHGLLNLVPAGISRILGEDVTGRFHWIEHHLCHASSAFYVSPFEEAAILSVDGIGEATSTWMGVGRGTSVRALREIRYPNSLGLLWTKASRFLGLASMGSGKPWGSQIWGPRTIFTRCSGSSFSYDQDGRFAVDPRYFQFRTANCSAFEELFGARRTPGDDIEDRHRDFAAALQRVTNEPFWPWRISFIGRLAAGIFARPAALRSTASRTV